MRVCVVFGSPGAGLQHLAALPRHALEAGRLLPGGDAGESLPRGEAKKAHALASKASGPPWSEGLLRTAQDRVSGRPWDTFRIDRSRPAPPQVATKDEVITGKLNCKPNAKNPRDLDIS
jgi:hypothetical protein